MKNKLTRVFSLIAKASSKAADFLAITTAGVLFSLITYQVFIRYFLNKGNPYTDELVLYFFVIMVYLGFVIATRDREHINVTMLVDRLPGKVKNVCHLLSLGIWLFFNIYAASTSIQLIEKMIPLAAKTAMNHILIWYFYLVLPVCFIWASFYVIRDIVLEIKVLCAKNTGVEDGGTEK